MYCSNCGEEINSNAVVCPHCGAATPNFYQQKQKTKSPGLAAVLSFFIPGLGQVYNGQVFTGIGAIIMAFVFFAWVFFHPGFLLVFIAWWLYCIWDGYNTAQKGE